MGNETNESLASQGLPSSEAALLAAAWAGAMGWTVRCTPRRRTVALDLPDGRQWFVKIRSGFSRAANREWNWLHTLPLLGFRTPVPVYREQRLTGSLLCTRALAGRPMDVVWLEASRRGTQSELAAWAVRVVAPMVRRLHGAGLVHRDLYWNHLLQDPERPDAEPYLLDVERVFAPRWRMRRWVVKDLAGLLASMPVAVSSADRLRFLRAYLGGVLQPGWKDLAEQIEHKAARIRGHVPRYG
jgi:tRNA A-37 threonylcarbamoyl transferase component Bud32